MGGPGIEQYLFFSEASPKVEYYFYNYCGEGGREGEGVGGCYEKSVMRVRNVNMPAWGNVSVLSAPD